eukprot:CAMPEP_0175960324 /NCGR_PEP_ID=MMETSP0108-20121206/35301_1 /TAXON_ID=195067 ORGANISM="Goniomonas pacifica, Strain CCMP1869" /NCGR_SAMPLE_ID=MMETSP0108 /ASSEMBLY_ACC=CAM_ASM_000204 /LENGTH=179 /DNA_ID=CAMNT_0017287899 /DNA_START=78 /DNA_END=614 /DNA_ORIENTATION=+
MAPSFALPPRLSPTSTSVSPISSTVTDLNLRLANSDVPPVPVSRFRPNIVIGNAPPLGEDDIRMVGLGGSEDEVLLPAVGPCGRCEMVNIDQETGQRGVEPLLSLSSYRRIKGRVHLGMLLGTNSGAVGTVLEKGQTITVYTSEDWQTRCTSPMAQFAVAEATESNAEQSQLDTQQPEL